VANALKVFFKVCEVLSSTTDKAKGSKIHENRAVVNRLKGELTHTQEQIAVREATGQSDNELVQKANDIRREIEINRRNYQG
jgi:hypothetical protein